MTCHAGQLKVGRKGRCPKDLCLYERLLSFSYIYPIFFCRMNGEYPAFGKILLITKAWSLLYCIFSWDTFTNVFSIVPFGHPGTSDGNGTYNAFLICIVNTFDGCLAELLYGEKYFWYRSISFCTDTFWMKGFCGLLMLILAFMRHVQIWLLHYWGRKLLMRPE